MPASTITGVADTARWVAMYRAIESDRPDALFHDPYARRLAGEHGIRIYDALPKSMRNAQWSVVTRTVQVDRHVASLVAGGVNLVMNLAAGLDTRPYRMSLPSSLTWVEVDQPALIAEKTALLADATPNCILQRISADLSKARERRELFEQFSAHGTRALVITEGLIMYLEEPEVVGLANDLLQLQGIEGWVTDIISPGLLRMIDKDWGKTLREGNAQMRFAAENGADWFIPHGWRAAEVQGTFHLAGQLKRLPWFMQLISRLPGTNDFNPKRPWAGTCLLKPTSP